MKQEKEAYWLALFVWDWCLPNEGHLFCEQWQDQQGSHFSLTNHMRLWRYPLVGWGMVSELWAFGKLFHGVCVNINFSLCALVQSPFTHMPVRARSNKKKFHVKETCDLRLWLRLAIQRKHVYLFVTFFRELPIFAKEIKNSTLYIQLQGNHRLIFTNNKYFCICLSCLSRDYK